MNLRPRISPTAGLALALLAGLTPAARAQSFYTPLNTYSSVTTRNSDGSFNRTVNEQVSFLQKSKHTKHGGGGVVVAFPLNGPVNNGPVVTQGPTLPHTANALTAHAHLVEAFRLLLLNKVDRETAEFLQKQTQTMESLLRSVSPNAAPVPMVSYGSPSNVIPSPMLPAPVNVVPPGMHPAPINAAPSPGNVLPTAPPVKGPKPCKDGTAEAATLEQLHNEVRELNRRLSQLEQTMQPVRTAATEVRKD